jgi:hypothetical protein
MIRQGFEGPKRTIGAGRDFVLDSVVVMGLEAIMINAIQGRSDLREYKIVLRSITYNRRWRLWTRIARSKMRNNMFFDDFDFEVERDLALI